VFYAVVLGVDEVSDLAHIDHPGGS
jgi:hypothetical protein